MTDDLDGTLSWQTTAGEADLDEEIESIALDDAGQLYAVGYTTDVDKDTWVASWTADGELLWSTSDLEIGDEGDDIAGDVVVLDSGVLVVGEATAADGLLDGYAVLLTP